MRIELSPGEFQEDLRPVFTARFMHDSNLIAEIKDAPHDIATQWAEAMKALHNDRPEIKTLGICMYCGSMRRKDMFCGDCDRVIRD